ARRRAARLRHARRVRRRRVRAAGAPAAACRAQRGGSRARRDRAGVDPSFRRGDGAQAVSGALAVPRERLGEGSGCRVEIVADAAALTEHFATTMLDELIVAREMGRERVVFIVPVGPIGQFERFAALVNELRMSLADLVVVNMDEYLTPSGGWI